ncbi:MAG: cytochrome b/b6 domain-containing protein [Nitrospiraceae bacterium]|nr:MAG: cytochrome b/b6 domain-containing protein [Nitrospiraceae bacterium]
MEKTPSIKVKNGIKYFYRFTVNQRIQHFILAWSVVTLVLTGMPLKFPDASWAPYLYSLFGGIHAAPVIHKVFGAILLALFVYHIVYLIYIIYKYEVLPMKKKDGVSTGKVLKVLANQPLVPNLKDAKDIWGLLKYLLYFTRKRPDGAKYTWKEKFDYWAPFWGMVIIGLSGLVMWNKELATTIFPGELINFSLIAHSDEALLAALFLFIWHWYNVHFSQAVFPMGTAFITGYLPEELMVEEHYEEYVEVMKKAGLEHEILPPHGMHAVASEEGGQA